tara:strand:+ start:4608 stop:5489 length:882 start_codon:yes stop_codon:yes gene_type:complete
MQISSVNGTFDEIIIADDGSTDDTFRTAQRLGLPIVKLSQNHGPGGARNRLAELSSADWIHFLDCDDRISPTFVSDIVPLIREDVDVLLCSGDFVDEDDNSLLQRWEFDEMSFDRNAVNAAFNTPIPSFCSMIRRHSFLDAGGFDEARKCWEDGDLHLRLAAAGAKFRVTKKVLSISPRHARGASANHLYCHQCRLEYVEGYVRQNLPIDKQLLAEEAAKLGYLFLSAGKTRSAWRAYSLIKEIGRFPAESDNPFFNEALARLPLNWSHCLSALAKIGVGRLRDFKARKLSST